MNGTMLGRFESTRVAEQIARQLLRSILDRTLRPGDRLPSERSLASRLGVNRASLREAIKKLEVMGLVRTRQGDGTRVLDFMSSAGVELLQHLLPVLINESPELVRDLLEVREALGREVARLAARRCQPEDLAELRRLVREASARPVTPQELMQHDMRLFAGLGRATHNRVVQLLMNSIQAAVAHEPDLFVQLLPSAEVALAHHQRVIELLEAGDHEAAANETEDYLADMSARFSS